MIRRIGRSAALWRGLPLVLACAVYLGAVVAATSPAIWRFESEFLAGGAPGYGEVAAGDYLQTSYRLWLFGHQLEHGRAPWIDPYSFRPESPPTVNPAVWPFGVAYWPLVAAFGPIVAWNLFVVLTILAAGLVTRAWLRELGLAGAPATAGGLVFAIAPYRLVQSVGHLLGAVSLLVPLSLWAFERGRRGSRWWQLLAGAALTSIPLSGQVHLALGAVPLFLFYVLCRSRAPATVMAAALAVAASVAAGLVIQRTTIAGTLGAGGRSLAEVAFYSAGGLDFLARHPRHGSESFVFLGWLTPLVALAGLWSLARTRRSLALALGLFAAVPILLAFGTNLPLYSALWHALPPFRYPRVPERLLPLAWIGLAALVAFAVAELLRLRHVRSRYGLAAAAVLAVLAVDLHTSSFRASASDPANAAYAALRSVRPGQLVELPAFLPDVHLGSVYLYYDMQAQWNRPGGYSTTAPVMADVIERRLRYLSCGDWSGRQDRLLRGIGVHAIAFHEGLFAADPTKTDWPWFAWRALVEHGFRAIARGGAVTMFVRGDGPGSPPPMPEPSRRTPVFCTGWYPPDQAGRLIGQIHASFWIYGSGGLRLSFRAPRAVGVRFSIDGRRATERTLVSLSDLRLRLGRRGWHLVGLDARLPAGLTQADAPRLVAYRLVGQGL